MKPLKTILVAMILGVTTFAIASPKAEAGRVGGPASQTVVLGPLETISFDIPFNAMEAAVVTTVGDGNANLVMTMHDADGHVALGTGFGDRRMATMNVYRYGFFRVTIRNQGPGTSTFVLSTN